MSKQELQAWEDQAPDTKRSPGESHSPSSDEAWEQAAMRVLERILGEAS